MVGRRCAPSGFEIRACFALCSRDRVLARSHLGAHQRYEVGMETDIKFHGILMFSVQISRSRSSLGSP